MPTVSIIIPTYNRAKFLAKALDSVLSQTFRDYEIIVVDDGSTDHTREVLKPYGAEITYIYQENSGVSAARNTGIQHATGEWIAFLDSDDEWLPGYLAFQVERIRQEPQAVAHMTNSFAVQTDGRKIETFRENGILSMFGLRPCMMVDKPFATVIKHRITTLQGFVVRHSTLLRAGLFDVNISISEDLDIVARVARQGPIGFCKEVLAHIHRRDESLENLSSLALKQGIYSCQCVQYIYEKLRGGDALTKNESAMLKKKLSSTKRAIANLLLKRGLVAEARVCYQEALSVYPSFKSLVKYAISLLPAGAQTMFVLKGRHVSPGAATLRPELMEILKRK
jgi:glycosyltransferase involved in cell wall biosynthesis